MVSCHIGFLRQIQLHEHIFQMFRWKKLRIWITWEEQIFLFLVLISQIVLIKQEVSKHGVQYFTSTLVKQKVVFLKIRLFFYPLLKGGQVEYQ